MLDESLCWMDMEISISCAAQSSWPTLTHWGRVTHICVGKLTIIGSDNGLSPGRRQANIWTNAGLLLIGPWGTNFSDISNEIHISSSIQENAFECVVCEMAAILSLPQCFNLGRVCSDINDRHNSVPCYKDRLRPCWSSYDAKRLK